VKKVMASSSSRGPRGIAWKSRLAARQDYTHVVGKQRDEHLAQPRVQEAEPLIGVEGKDHPLGELPEAFRGLLGITVVKIDELPEHLNQTSFGGFDSSTVQLDDRST
jgi:hypothetical protein